jgi:hypothetical protein
MNFRYLQLIFPVLVALHNAEEAIGIPRWAQRSGPWFGQVRPAVFRFGLAVLTTLALALTVLSALAGKSTLWANLTFGYMVAMLFNALVPHIGVSLATRALMPGVRTAALLNLPILSCLTALALKQGYVSAHDALVFSLVVPASLLLTIPLLFQLGKALGF